jgi:hypothetical protein
MRLNLVIPSLFALACFVPAQAQNIRGEVRIDSDTGAYYLHCTGWRVKNSKVIPADWVGKPLKMKAVNVGTFSNPQMDVKKAALTYKGLELSEMIIGTKAVGSVAAPVGSYVSVCLDVPANTNWAPFLGVGVWLLGPDPCGFADGFVYDTIDRTHGMGQFQFSYMVPLHDVMVGQVFIGQAMVFSPQGLYFTNPDCRMIQSH